MVFQPTAVREISHSGMLIETAFPLQLNSLHDFRLSLGGQSVVLKGRVANSEISDVDQDVVTYRSGVEFVNPVDRVATAIADFIQSLPSSEPR
jgi:PilZ domain